MHRHLVAGCGTGDGPGPRRFELEIGGRPVRFEADDEPGAPAIALAAEVRLPDRDALRIALAARVDRRTARVSWSAAFAGAMLAADRVAAGGFARSLRRSFKALLKGSAAFLGRSIAGGAFGSAAIGLPLVVLVTLPLGAVVALYQAGGVALAGGASALAAALALGAWSRGRARTRAALLDSLAAFDAALVLRLADMLETEPPRTRQGAGIVHIGGALFGLELEHGDGPLAVSLSNVEAAALAAVDPARIAALLPAGADALVEVGSRVETLAPRCWRARLRIDGRDLGLTLISAGIVPAPPATVAERAYGARHAPQAQRLARRLEGLARRRGAGAG